MELAEDQPIWDVSEGDAEIKEIPQTGYIYFGHSTSTVDWLHSGKGLRVGSYDGNIHVTAIDMPSDPEAFLGHLKLRVDPQRDFYHRGKYLVVLAVPPAFFVDRGILAEQAPDDWKPPYTARNLKMVEPNPGEDSSYLVPPRFILGYYDGETNSFHKNPLWEPRPTPTDFGLAAERRLLGYQQRQLESPEKHQASIGANVTRVIECSDADDEVW